MSFSGTRSPGRFRLACGLAVFAAAFINGLRTTSSMLAAQALFVDERKEVYQSVDGCVIRWGVIGLCSVALSWAIEISGSSAQRTRSLEHELMGEDVAILVHRQEVRAAIRDLSLLLLAILCLFEVLIVLLPRGIHLQVFDGLAWILSSWLGGVTLLALAPGDVPKVLLNGHKLGLKWAPFALLVASYSEGGWIPFEPAAACVVAVVCWIGFAIGVRKRERGRAPARNTGYQVPV